MLPSVGIEWAQSFQAVPKNWLFCGALTPAGDFIRNGNDLF